MIKFYYNPSPNPSKVALFLEESGLEYEVIPIDVRKGEQFSERLQALNPNCKIPVIIDDGVTVFDSNAILLYLAEKTSRFLPENTAPARAQLLSWMMFVASGIGPYSGQAVHFRHFAPEPKEYPLNRYTYEARRHWSIVDARLAGSRYMMGDRYTIVDMAVWGWARVIPFMLGEDAWPSFPQVKRLIDEISARPAGERVTALATKYQFKTEMDDEARNNMFLHDKHLKEA